MISLLRTYCSFTDACVPVAGGSHFSLNAKYEWAALSIYNQRPLLLLFYE